MKTIINIIIFFGILFVVGVIGANLSLATDSDKPRNVWAEELKGLSLGMSRTDAEQVIQIVRNTPTDYELSAMDTSEYVAYRLDVNDALVVHYRPGMPHKKTLAGSAPIGPIDGALMEFWIVALK